MYVHFLNALPFVFIYFIAVCVLQGAERSPPAGLVFTLIWPPSRISILLFVHNILHVLLNMLHYTVL